MGTGTGCVAERKGLDTRRALQELGVDGRGREGLAELPVVIPISLSQVQGLSACWQARSSRAGLGLLLVHIMHIVDN